MRRSSATPSAKVGYLPDTSHARLIELYIEDNEIKDVVLASEAEGPASCSARRSAASGRRC